MFFHSDEAVREPPFPNANPVFRFSSRWISNHCCAVFIVSLIIVLYAVAFAALRLHHPGEITLDKSFTALDEENDKYFWFVQVSRGE